MIQRIQTVFLLLVAIAGILVFFFPIAYYEYDSVINAKFFIYKILDLRHDPFPDTESQLFPIWLTLPLIVIQGFIVVLATYTIFKFKNRTLQVRLNMLNVFLNVILVGALFLYSDFLINRALGIKPDFKIGVFFPLISIIMVFLATRFIKMDERLIRSADRLR